jgi:hypothetical protein
MFGKKRGIPIRDHTVVTLPKFILLILVIPLLLVVDLMITILNMKERLTPFFGERV